MFSRFPWSLTMTFLQTERTTFTGELQVTGTVHINKHFCKGCTIYISTDKLPSDNEKCIISLIIAINYQLIIPRQIAFNKHVLKVYLATAASVDTINSESRRVYSTGIRKLQCLPKTAQRTKLIMKK